MRLTTTPDPFKAYEQLQIQIDFDVIWGVYGILLKTKPTGHTQCYSYERLSWCLPNS